MKDIIEYDGVYKVTEDARIFKDLGHHLVSIKPCINAWGYLVFSMSKNGIRNMFRLHRIVAQYFVPNPYPELFDQVNHLDGNKLNCIASNLAWTDNKGNNIHKVEMGLSRSSNPRIAIDMRNNVIQSLNAGIGPCVIAKDCGIGIQTVYRIKKSIA